MLILYLGDGTEGTVCNMDSRLIKYVLISAATLKSCVQKLLNVVRNTMHEPN